jgi:hypothetical protein
MKNGIVGLEQNSHLIDIHLLAQFIEEKLLKVNKNNVGPILNMAMAKTKLQLPKGLALNSEKKMDPKKKAILIAQNMLFFAAQMSKKKYFEEIISYFNNMLAHSHPLTIVVSKDDIIYHLVLKELPPKSIGQFFYQKFVEMVKKGEYEPSKAMEKMKIGESSSKNEHDAGSNSA